MNRTKRRSIPISDSRIDAEAEIVSRGSNVNVAWKKWWYWRLLRKQFTFTKQFHIMTLTNFYTSDTWVITSVFKLSVCSLGVECKGIFELTGSCWSS